ncbi:MAG: hypothetical protein P8L46_08680 [Acidimicrobiales bacterium]|nr:hypothetical protein [Acidimicrobiales bacterium]
MTQSATIWATDVHMISALMDPDSLVKRNRTAGFFDLNLSGQTWTTAENAAMARGRTTTTALVP